MGRTLGLAVTCEEALPVAVGASGFLSGGKVGKVPDHGAGEVGPGEAAHGGEHLEVLGEQQRLEVLGVHDRGVGVEAGDGSGAVLGDYDRFGAEFLRAQRKFEMFKI